MPNGCGVRWVECLLIIGTDCRVQVLCLILDSSVGSSAGIQSAEDWVSETLWVRILHSAEENNLSPFDSKLACLCQSIEINNNKYVYRQSQVRMPNGCGVRWAECLLIIGRAVEFKFYAWSSIAQSVCQQAFSLLKIGFQRPSGFESCIQQRKTTCLLSIRKSLACARASKLTTTNIYICIYVYIYIYIYIYTRDINLYNEEKISIHTKLATDLTATCCRTKL